MRWEGRELHHICSIVGSLTISKYSILYRLCPSSLFNTSAYDVSRQATKRRFRASLEIISVGKPMEDGE